MTSAFVLIVFFNEERTDYLAYGPFKTFEAAEKASRRVLQSFAAALTTVITRLINLEDMQCR